MKIILVLEGYIEPVGITVSDPTKLEDLERLKDHARLTCEYGQQKRGSFIVYDTDNKMWVFSSHRVIWIEIENYVYWHDKLSQTTDHNRAGIFNWTSCDLEGELR